MATSFDAIIIGTGQSGPSLAARFTGEGMKTAILERKLFGGTCVNVGCIPTKTLVASARAAYMARRGGDFGVIIDGPVSVDMKAVKARKDAVVRQSNEGVTNWLKNMKNLTVYRGHGRLTGANSVEVNGDVLEAEKIVLNVGARARVPEMPGIGDVDYLTNTSMMEIDFLPEHLMIVGGSYIGLEFAQMYRRFGSRVTVIEMGERLIARDDEDVSAAVKDILEAEGVEVRLNAECVSVEKRGDRVALTAACEPGTEEIVGSHLLLAVGRVPNPDDLGLDQAGVETDRRCCLTVDDQLLPTAPGLGALGASNYAAAGAGAAELRGAGRHRDGRDAAPGRPSRVAGVPRFVLDDARLCGTRGGGTGLSGNDSCSGQLDREERDAQSASLFLWIPVESVRQKERLGRAREPTERRHD